MKKFASVLLAVLVAFSMFSFVVSAADVALTVSADKTTVKAGDTVTVTVALSEKSGLSAFIFDVKYDAAALKITEMTSGDATVVVNPTFAAGVARATGATTNVYETAVSVCTIKFEALEAADSTIAVTVEEAVDTDYNPVEVKAGSVAIKGAVADEPSTDEPSTDEPSTDEPSTDEPCADGHTWSTWAVEKVAECKKDGLKARNCTICGEKETEVIPATGNCSYKWVVTKEATATEYGEKVLKCTMCGDVKETQKLAVKTDSITEPAIPNTDAIA